MSNSSVSALSMRASPLRARRAVALVLDSSLERTPERPGDFDLCARSLARACEDGGPDYSVTAALASLRAALYVAPGREAEIGMLWREAVAAGVFAVELAALESLDRTEAAEAALLHRAGEAWALAALAHAEAEARTRLDVPSRAQLLASHEGTLASRLVRDWELPAPVGAAVLGWKRFGELGRLEDLSSIVYYAHLLAVELVHRDFAAPGLQEAMDEQLALDPVRLASIRARAGLVQALL
jgi:HD-like signal output (HDOD) protein